MTSTDLTALLRETIDTLQASKDWLVHSYDKCLAIKLSDNMPFDDYDAFEGLTARFARISDIYLQKLFRNIDAVELEAKGSLLDALNRAEKRGIIDSVDQIRSLRELRNEIAHEYILKSLLELFADTLKNTPLLISLIDRAIEYCEQKHL